MADLRDPGGIQRDLFCRTVWIAESDVGRNCGDVGTGTVSCRYERIKGRIPGNILGGLTFIVLYLVLPESMYSLIGILGGIGVGLSATYGWQAVFNSWGAMSIAMTFLGVGGAIFYRIFNNAFGAFYALVFYQLFSIGMDWIAEVKKKRVSV